MTTDRHLLEQIANAPFAHPAREVAEAQRAIRDLAAATEHAPAMVADAVKLEDE